MALLITMSKGGTTYDLQAEHISHSFARYPAITPLPAAEGTKSELFSIDLGMLLEIVNISGTVNSTSTGITDPTKDILAGVCRTWWAFGDTVSSLINLTIDTAESYYVNIKTAEFTREGGIENRWRFSISFAIRSEVS